jgi:alpha/beta hydrolase fold
MLVLFNDGTDSHGPVLSALLGAVVLSATLTSVPEAVATMEWAADHAAELNADPEWLIVAGVGSGAALAASVALFARDSGWPSIARQVLIQPNGDASLLSAPPLTGVAPATVVTVGHGEPVAVVLRHAGVDAEEVHGDDLPAALEALARSIRSTTRRGTS